MTYALPELAYGYGDLAPVISEDIMRLHHDKHHQTYVDKLNTVVSGLGLDDDVEQLLRHLDALPDDVRTTIRNNGGGHLNHSLFWQMMHPDGGGQPGGGLHEGLTARYGTFQTFVDAFSEAALGVFGSGWVWLMPDLSIVTTPNQDNPIMRGDALPILGCDVWEHAYYLDYKNARDAYMKAWWEVVHWPEVEKRYGSAIIS